MSPQPRKGRITPADTIASDIVSPGTHGRLDELNPAALRRKLADAQEQLTYWQGAKFRATRADDKTAAAARVTLWEMQVAACQRRLAQLSAASEPFAVV